VTAKLTTGEGILLFSEDLRQLHLLHFTLLQLCIMWQKCISLCVPRRFEWVGHFLL